jgi:hypothetical protein
MYYRKHYMHSSEPALQAVIDHGKGIYKPFRDSWRLGQRAEYNKVWNLLEEGNRVIFSDMQEKT